MTAILESCGPSGLEAVPHARLGPEVTRTGVVRLQLSSDPAHQDPQVLRLGLVLGSPDVVEELALGHQSAGVADQDLDDVPLLGCEVDVLSVPGHPLVDQVDGELLGLHPGCLVAGGDPPERRPEAGQQLVHAERLGDVVVGPGVEGLHLAHALMAGGKDDDGDRAPAPDAPDHIDAVDAREAQVQQDQVGMPVGGHVEALLAGAGHDHLVAPGGQADGQGLQQLGIVIADEDPAPGLARAVASGDRWGARRVHGVGPAGTPESTGGWDGVDGRAAAPVPFGMISGILITMVQPPPGVSSMSSSPPMATTKPRATARPRPTPTRLVESPRRWNGSKTRSRSARGIPGPRSMTRMSTRPATRPASMRRPDPPAWDSALSTRFATARSSSTGSVLT